MQLPHRGTLHVEAGPGDVLDASAGAMLVATDPRASCALRSATLLLARQHGWRGAGSPFFHQSSQDRPSSGAATHGVAMASRASRCWSANCTLVMSIGAARSRE